MRSEHVFLPVQLVRVFFLLVVCCLAGLLWSSTNSLAISNDESDGYLKAWNKHLEQFKKGDSIDDVRQTLPQQATFVGRTGALGTGRSSWVFRIDDRSDLIVLCDSGSKLLDGPLLCPKKQWQRYPNGTIQER